MSWGDNWGSVQVVVRDGIRKDLEARWLCDIVSLGLIFHLLICSTAGVTFVVGIECNHAWALKIMLSKALPQTIHTVLHSGCVEGNEG